MERVDCTKEAENGMSHKLDLRTGTEWYNIAQPFIINTPPTVFFFHFLKNANISVIFIQAYAIQVATTLAHVID
jgi:hypothetical protein